MLSGFQSEVTKPRNNIHLRYEYKLIRDPQNVGGGGSTKGIQHTFINAVEDLIVPYISFHRSFNVTPSITISKFSFNPVSECEVFEVISFFLNKHPYRNDEIPMCLIKESALYFTKPLSHLVNSSLISRFFLNHLKSSSSSDI